MLQDDSSAAIDIRQLAVNARPSGTLDDADLAQALRVQTPAWRKFRIADDDDEETTLRIPKSEKAVEISVPPLVHEAIQISDMTEAVRIRLDEIDIAGASASSSSASSASSPSASVSASSSSSSFTGLEACAVVSPVEPPLR